MTQTPEQWIDWDARRAVIGRAFQQAATAAMSEGISAKEIKEYLRGAYGFGTVHNPAWQPIETAPKDGSFILGAYFYRGHEMDVSVVAWGGSDWIGYCDGERSIRAQGDTYIDYHEPFLTHWMPLPAPPQEQE